MPDQLLVLLGVLAAATVIGLVTRARDGRFRGATDTRPQRLAPDDLGSPLTAAATFVLLSSATCSTCPQVRRVLADVAAAEADVDVRELRTEEHLGLVRRLGVMRTPTVLLLDRDGAVLSRTSGPLRPDQARTALADAPLTARS